MGKNNRKHKIDLRRAPDGVIVDFPRVPGTAARTSVFDGIVRPTESETITATLKSMGENELSYLRDYVKSLPEGDEQRALDQLLAKLQAFKELHSYRQVRLF
jgi:hypothetical protein